MISQFYIYFGALILLMTLGRVVWRRGGKPVDWSLVVAFIRLDFPPHQRDLAQKIAAGLAEIVGLKIKQLRPEHRRRHNVLFSRGNDCGKTNQRCWASAANVIGVNPASDEAAISDLGAER